MGKIFLYVIIIDMTNEINERIKSNAPSVPKIIKNILLISFMIIFIGVILFFYFVSTIEFNTML